VRNETYANGNVEYEIYKCQSSIFKNPEKTENSPNKEIKTELAL
jgi:hypothetical protein